MTIAKKQDGFTLLELLVVISIVGILTAVVYTALDPNTQLMQARDSVRQNDVQKILSSIILNQTDHGKFFISTIEDLTPGSVYMIVNGAMTLGCDDNNVRCDTAVTNDTACVDLSGLVDQYLNQIPISPSNGLLWDDGSADGKEGTGYTLERDAQGILQVRSCESENTTEIIATRS